MRQNEPSRWKQPKTWLLIVFAIFAACMAVWNFYRMMQAAG